MNSIEMNIDEKGFLSMTPLHLALLGGKMEVVNLLLSYKRYVSVFNM